MKRLAWLLPAAALAACGGGGSNTTTTTGSGGSAITGTGTTSTTTGTAGGSATSTTGPGGGSTTSTTGTGGGSTTSTTGTGGGSTTTTTTSTSSSSGMPCGQCPSGYVCGTANNLPVCRAPSGIPLFSHVFLVLMENTSLSTLQEAMSGGNAPNLKSYTSMYASGSDYHGAAHPSLPNYIALTSGATQGITCDCEAHQGQGSCNVLTCLTGCSCDQPATVKNIADQLETAGKSWMAFGEDMGSPCNVNDSGNYAQRHVPFLYYDDIQTNAARCDAHVVDFGNFAPASAAAYNFIAPNLVDDMHNPDPTFSATTVNIPNGDMWLGTQVPRILGASTYTQGGLFVVVWDEDDGSGGILGNSDDPIGIFVMSPYAKSGGYVSSVKANHYSLLATIEDGLDLPHLGMAANPGAGIAANLGDYFPAN